MTPRKFWRIICEVKKKTRARKPPPGITPQQQRFTEEYVVTLNATKAAIAAGYGKAGAHTRGSNLLKKPAIRKAVDAAISERSTRTKITTDRVLEELFFLLTSNVDDYEGGDGKVPLRVKQGIDPRYMRAVSSVKKRILMGSEGGPRLESVEFRLWDKPKSIVTTMRHLGMLNDKLTVDVGEELKRIMADAAGDFDSRLAGVVARLRQKQPSGPPVGE